MPRDRWNDWDNEDEDYDGYDEDDEDDDERDEELGPHVGGRIVPEAADYLLRSCSRSSTTALNPPRLVPAL